MSSTNLLLFTGAAFLLVITPGPDILYVLTRGMTQGRKAGLVSALGFGVGVVVHTTFAVVGLSALILSSAMAFQLVKYIGAIYLVVLGVRAITNKNHFAMTPPSPSPSPSLSGHSEQTATPPPHAPHYARAIFWQSLLANVLNPKVTLFFLAFLPQFVAVEQGMIWLQMLLLGAIFMLLTLVVFGMVAVGAGTLGNWLMQRPRVAERLPWATGSVLILLGVRLALPDAL